MSTTKQGNALTMRPVIKATDRYRKFLQVSSIFLPDPLTSLEMDILDELYHVSNGVLTTESRKHIRETLGKTSQQLNNYILMMRDKKIIIDDKVNPQLLIPIPEIAETEEKPHFTINIAMQIAI